jgi:RHS repeat-associated protein
VLFRSSSYGYTDEWTDGSGLEYLRARYYSSAQGRFTSQDPFSGMLSNPATQNPYVYEANNPVRYTDPSGKIRYF